MLKTRNFFTGLGIGFLLSGFILVITNGFIAQDITSVNKQYSIDELKVIAKKENLYLYTKDELDELLKEQENSVNSNQEDGKINRTYFSIPKGFSSDEVADYLLEIGLLMDKEVFLDILDNNNLTTKIIAKTYYYEQALSTEELIELITNTDQANW